MTPTQLISRFLWNRLSGGIQWRMLWLSHATFNVGVCGVFLTDDNKVLLLNHVLRRRSHWGLPSGWLKRGETIFEGIRREVKEEVALDCRPLKVIAINAGFRLRIEMVVVGDITDAPIEHFDREIAAAAFFSLDSLPDDLSTEHRRFLELATSRSSANQGIEA